MYMNFKLIIFGVLCLGIGLFLIPALSSYGTNTTVTDTFDGSGTGNAGFDKYFTPTWIFIIFGIGMLAIGFMGAGT